MSLHEFIEKVGRSSMTKENVKNIFLESDISFDDAIYGIHRNIVSENLLDSPKKSNLGGGAEGIKLKLKIYRRSKESEKYKIAAGYLTSIAAETLGEFHVKKPMEYIGLELEKGTISVDDAGNFCGMGMKGGNIAVSRNCGSFAGFEMSGGKIKINGLAGTFLGHKISGGKIYARKARSTGFKKNENIVVDEIIEQDALTKLAKDAAKDLIFDEMLSPDDLNSLTKKTVKDFCSGTAVLEKKDFSIETIKKERMLIEKIYGVKYGLNEDKTKKKSGSMTRMMQNVYGYVDTKKIAEKTEKTEIKDENFEKIKQIFKGREVNKKEDIKKINIETDALKKIIEETTPSTLKEKKIIGYLTSIVAERLDENKEELNIKKVLNFVGLELEKGKITADRTGQHTGKGMKGGEIIIKGICEGDVGEEMTGGKIIINSSVYGGYAGWRMKGGEIFIEGSCWNAGLGMRGGKITIKEDAKTVGEGMENGEINVYGNAGLIGSRMRNGIIRCRRGEISKEKIGGEVIII